MRYLGIFFLLIAQTAWGQYNIPKQTMFEIPVGFQWQSTYMNYGWENPHYPTAIEWNIQGFGLRLGGKMRVLKNTYLSLVPAFRYDHLYNHRELDTLFRIIRKTKRLESIIDIHAGLERRFGRFRQHRVGIGASIHNLKKSFTFQNPTIPIFVNMQFNSLSFFYGRSFRRGFSAEARFMVTQKNPNVAYVSDKRFMFLNFSAYYNLAKIWEK